MREDIDARVAELRELVDSARSMPMSASVMVNRAELLDLLAGLEQAIDAALAKANEVVATRDDLVARGEEEAAEIVRRAQAERDKLVSDTDVYRLGTERADELQSQAQREAEELRAETDQYIESSLANFELTLERTLEAVRRGRARLNGGPVSQLGDDSDVDQITLPKHLDR